MVKRGDIVGAPQVGLSITGKDGHFSVGAMAALGHELFDAPINIYFKLNGELITSILRRPQDRKSCGQREIIVPAGAAAGIPPEEPWLRGHPSPDGRTLYLRAFTNSARREKPEDDHPAYEYRWNLNGYLSRLSQSNAFKFEPVDVESLAPNFPWQARPLRYYGTRLNALAIVTGEVEPPGGQDVHSRFIVMPFMDGFRPFEDPDWRWIEAKAVGTIDMYKKFFDFWNFETLFSVALYEARSALTRCDAKELQRARDYVASLQKQLCPRVAAQGEHNCHYPAQSYSTLSGQVHDLLDTIDFQLRRLTNYE
jgi:hypothetical protein